MTILPHWYHCRRNLPLGSHIAGSGHPAKFLHYILYQNFYVRIQMGYKNFKSCTVYFENFMKQISNSVPLFICYFSHLFLKFCHSSAFQTLSVRSVYIKNINSSGISSQQIWIIQWKTIQRAMKKPHTR